MLRPLSRDSAHEAQAGVENSMQSAPTQPLLIQQQLQQIHQQQQQQPAIMRTLTAGNAATTPGAAEAPTTSRLPTSSASSWVSSQTVSLLNQVAAGNPVNTVALAMATGRGFVPAAPTQATAPSIATAATEALKKLTADAKRMRAEAARRAKELTHVNRKLHKLQQQKAELTQKLQDQGAFEGIDIDATTVKQLQDRIAEIAKQRQEVAERLKVELEDLEKQQQILEILKQEDSEMDARFAREFNEILESLIQEMQQKQSAEQQTEVDFEQVQV